MNKKDVGYRLALAAQKVAHGEKHIVYSGPIYKSMKVEGNRVILTFSNTGKGLVSRNGGKLNCFEICRNDGEYYPGASSNKK